MVEIRQALVGQAERVAAVARRALVEPGKGEVTALTLVVQAVAGGQTTDQRVKLVNRQQAELEGTAMAARVEARAPQVPQRLRLALLVVVVVAHLAPQMLLALLVEWKAFGPKLQIVQFLDPAVVEEGVMGQIPVELEADMAVALVDRA